MNLRCLVLLFACFVSVAACGRRQSAETDEQPERRPPVISADVLRIGEVQQLIVDQRGKVVVVDLWALW